jgi:hypothetical protein
VDQQRFQSDFLSAGKINDVATFDLFFRKNPFKVGPSRNLSGGKATIVFMNNYRDMTTSFFLSVVLNQLQIRKILTKNMNAFRTPGDTRIRNRVYIDSSDHSSNYDYSLKISTRSCQSVII